MDEQPTELDDEQDLEPGPSVETKPSPQQAPAHRPRVFAGPAPEAIDPFAEPFEEEELVLDSFAALASIFGTRAPRVENRREPAISRLVQDALDAFAGKTEAEAKDEPAVAAEKDSAPIERKPGPRGIRLAVVEEGPASPQVAEPFSTAKPGAARSWQPAAAIEANPLDGESDDSADAILVIEDDSNDGGPPTTGVRRESYRQLFSRLRHGA